MAGLQRLGKGFSQISENIEKLKVADNAENSQDNANILMLYGQKKEIFIAHMDTFPTNLLGNPLSMKLTRRRIELYQHQGALIGV